MADEATADDAQIVDTAATETPEADAPEAEAVTVEALASEMGWKPESEWRGDKSKWRPAAEFVRSTVDVNKSLARDLRDMKAHVERTARTSAAIVEQQVQERIALAEARFAEAVDAGDQKAARQASDAIARLQAETFDAQPADAEASFARENPWYGKDEEATAYAVSVSQRLAAQGASIAEQLEQAQASVRKRFPELFDAPPARKPAPMVNTMPTRGAGGNRARGVSDLPPSARQAAAMFVKKGLVKSEADYAKQYWAENN